jgi:hypothetical protein
MNKHTVLKVVTLWMLFLLLRAAAGAAQIRGRVQRVYPNGLGPVVGVPVTVYNPQIGRSIVVYTDGAGMYYLAIPAGQYYLEIWINPGGGPPLVFGPFNVVEPATDIPPVTV